MISAFIFSDKSLKHYMLFTVDPNYTEISSLKAYSSILKLSRLNWLLHAVYTKGNSQGKRLITFSRRINILTG